MPVQLARLMLTGYLLGLIGFPGAALVAVLGFIVSDHTKDPPDLSW